MKPAGQYSLRPPQALLWHWRIALLNTSAKVPAHAEHSCDILTGSVNVWQSAMQATKFDCARV
ncbi:hypothetical protein MES4922_370045 [Mesorhizobium ventifaucium]|uniref:Uncharacterized protein n=1 Tax=Mesorhizobium ventifaucium TaxID=666020 RepID=A0ABM9E6Q0_9HYPH|nr:hypothetical protein MES4922_370045 [Mesorhizobium ventifaucium]